MTPEEKKDLAMAVAIELLEGKISRVRWDSFHLDLYALRKGLGHIQGIYYKSDGEIVMREGMSHYENLRTLFHESYHSQFDKDEDKARIYCQCRLDVWFATSGRDKWKKLVDGILKTRS